MIKYTVSDKEASTRLDSFISDKLSSLSRSFIQKLCVQNKVTVNGGIERTSYKLRAGDKVWVDFDPIQLKTIPRVEIEVIYEDNDCIVVNKPAGLLTHSKGAFNPEATVATFIQPKTQNMAGDRAGIVHRLDRATSGVIICAKTPEALAWLQKQFSQRKVKKTYYAIIEGHFDPKAAIIDIPIERHPRDPKTFRTSASGKPAITEYKVIKNSPHYNLVELKPRTGRTHQLRVHLNHLGHPIIGDEFYKGTSSDRLYLHAQKLELTLPSRIRKVFEVPLPPAFNTMMENDG